MALPLIYAAGATVARFIAKNGLKAAAKKYTKKAISGGKKHAKDLVTKKTTGQKQTTAATKGQRTYRAGQRVALGTGVAATSAVTTTSSNSKKTKLRKKNAELRMKLNKEKSKPTVSAPKESPRPKPRPSKNKATPRPKARPSKNAPLTSPRPKVRTVDKSPNAEMTKSPKDYKKKK